MRNAIVVPAVLESTVARTRARFASLAPLHVPLHLDFMDGVFVHTRSISARSLTLLTIPRGTTAHLMVEHPDMWASECWNAGIRDLAVHVESSITPSLIRELRRYFTVTLALNPNTSLRRLLPYHPLVTRFHVLTIHPGRQGAPFLQSQLTVVRTLRRRNPRSHISVDGGMTERTIPMAMGAGANTIIVGSALKNQAHLRERYRALLAAAS